MPIELPLPRWLSQARWKVKIQDKERVEPPHVSILRGTDKWRINLRTGEFMDKQPKPSDIPEPLIALIKKKRNWKWLCEQWDGKYPDNPLSTD
ncbi:MAG: hypothetical protein WD063_06380 [Pirellulales bacterium]